MFDGILIESAGKDRHAGAWVSTILSIIAHVALLRAAIMAGVHAQENPVVIPRPIAAFIVAAAPPPPPPPPPPGPSPSVATTPRVERKAEPTEPVFQQLTDIPKDLPRVAENLTPQKAPETPADGGVPGGMEGGQRGGIVGGQIGGEIGGKLGGEIGGKIGGTLGGNGTQLGGGNTVGTPVRVGGNVLPPKIVTRVDPQYTEAARRAKIEGIVIIEAVIDRSGNVTEARVLKALSFGLDQQALNAILAWKFKPGTLNGQPVPVYYNLTVNFQID
ncbi:MAG TPA: energy transducer TonB [Thermoanaerobaculia bacterium]